MRIAVAGYDDDAPADIRESQVAIGLDDVIAALVCDFDWSREQIADRVYDAVEIAFEDKTADE